MCSDIAVSIFPFRGGSVSDIIAEIRWIRIGGTRKTLPEAGPPPQRPNRKETVARNRSPEVDEVILFLLYYMLENMSDVIFNNSFYRFRDELSEQDMFRFQRASLLLVFPTIVECVTKAVNALQLPWLHM